MSTQIHPSSFRSYSFHSAHSAPDVFVIQPCLNGIEHCQGTWPDVSMPPMAMPTMPTGPTTTAAASSLLTPTHLQAHLTMWPSTGHEDRVRSFVEDQSHRIRRQERLKKKRHNDTMRALWDGEQRLWTLPKETHSLADGVSFGASSMTLVHPNDPKTTPPLAHPIRRIIRRLSLPVRYIASELSPTPTYLPRRSDDISPRRRVSLDPVSLLHPEIHCQFAALGYHDT